MRVMQCISFYEWRCIDAGEHMISAPFLGETGRDRAPGRCADFLCAPRHAKADMPLTTNMGQLRSAEALTAARWFQHKAASQIQTTYIGSSGVWEKTK